MDSNNSRGERRKWRCIRVARTSWWKCGGSTSQSVENQAKNDLDTRKEWDDKPHMEIEEENVTLGKRSSSLQSLEITPYFNVFTW